MLLGALIFPLLSAISLLSILKIFTESDEEIKKDMEKFIGREITDRYAIRLHMMSFTMLVLFFMLSVYISVFCFQNVSQGVL